MFLLFSPVTLCIIAALFPALFLMRVIYRQDKIEKEPGGLLLSLIFMGVLAALAAMVLENIGQAILTAFVSPDNPFFVVLFAFLVVALAEEGAKYFLMRKKTWNNPNFNYTFDGIIYAVFVSLGFAGFENIGYVMGYGLSVAPARALLAIPGHLAFSVFMGFYYARAKTAFLDGNRGAQKAYERLALLVPVFLHGFYDACAMTGTSFATLLFFIFVIVVDIAVFRVVRHESRTDRPV